VGARKRAFFSSGIFIGLRYLLLPLNLFPYLKNLFHETGPNATPMRFFYILAINCFISVKEMLK